MPEILCDFLPNQRSAGRQVVSCLFTRKSLGRHTQLVRLAKFYLSREVLITAQNVQEIVRNTGGKIRWRYRNSSVFPSVRDLFKDVLPDSPKIAVVKLDKEKVAQYFSLGKQNRTAKNQPLLNDLMYYLIFPTERRKQHILSIVQVRT